ncbi:hypothetical protein JCM10449v2_006170 [Rhodotorula kratochvilovae]
MQSAFDPSSDFPSFSLPLDTPSKLFRSDSPNPWSIGSGLTPSLFGNSLNPSRGFTPSITDEAAEARAEPNPFELSLGGKRHSVASGAFDDGKTGDFKGSEHQFDLLSSSTLFGGRKRAMSSPAIRTPGGSALDFLVPSSQAPAVSALDNFHLNPSKRPRIDSLASSALSTSDRIFSSNERESDESPASSVIDTPPDSTAFLPEGKGRKSAGDIEVNTAFYPPASIGPPQPSTSALLSQLQQQRSAMIAAGTATFSQNAPLPMDPNSLDITVKAEAVDETLALRPPVTRGQSKKGKAPALMSFASATASIAGASEEGTPAPSPKRKGGRKKASSVKPLEGEKKEGEEEDDEDVKRKQFLERNRIAACKSRQKKKEKTAALERLAADLCNRNHVLQQTALALRQEALTLRQLMHAHQGCNCEHAQGYIIRDQQGGGLTTIEQLAGRTLHLDYSIPPAMGTEDDVYSFIDHPDGGMFPAPGGATYTGAQVPGPAIPVVSKPSFVQASTTSPQRPGQKPTSSSTRSMMTRRAAAAAGAHVGSDITPGLAPAHMADAMDFSDSDFSGLERLDTAAAMEAGIDAAAPMSAVDPSTQAILDMPLARHLRANSAPPTTPGWDGAAPKGDYFAPKSTAIEA